MLTYVIEHCVFVFLFFTVPFLGLGVQMFASKKQLTYASYGSAFLLLPIITGYSYALDNVYGYLVFVLAICGYAFLIRKVRRKLRITLLFSGPLFLICGVLGFIGSMAGTISLEADWKFKNYKIEYVRDQGFSGRPLMTYQLSKYAFVPIFVKYLDTRVDNDTTNACLVHFENTGFNFNKCSSDSSYFDKK